MATAKARQINQSIIHSIVISFAYKNSKNTDT